MKLLRREIQIKRATQRFLQKKAIPDLQRITKLTGEIFELQRAMLTKTGTLAPIPVR
jgi:hypothetical protein